MANLKQKKGAVELSLNLIIMLIIGMVVLGLVIGFVNSLVNQGTKSFETQLGDNEKLKLEEVARCSDNLCMIPDPSIKVLKGGKQNVFIKVRAFASAIDCKAGPLADASCEVKFELVDQEGTNQDSAINLAGPGFKALEGEESAQMYTLKVEKDTAIGTYYLTLKLYDGEDEVSKQITLDIE